jgi:excisionase family DNA binding protein
MSEPPPTQPAESDPPDGRDAPHGEACVPLARACHRVPDDADDVLTVPEAAALLKIGRNALYEACGRNEVPYRRIGRQIRFSRAALVAWLGSWSKQGAQKGQ